MSIVTSDAVPGTPGVWRHWFAWYPVRVAPIGSWLTWYKSYRWMTIVEGRSFDSAVIAGRLVHRWEYRI